MVDCCSGQTTRITMLSTPFPVSERRQDEAPDRAALTRARDKAARLEAELGALKVRQLALDALGPAGAASAGGAAAAAAAHRSAELQAIGERKQG